MHSPVIFVVVGASGSGKGLLLRSLRDMGERHVIVIPKATSRDRKTTDGSELVFFSNGSFPEKYNIIYGNYRNKYGIATEDIWNALSQGRHALLICSNFASRDSNGLPLEGMHDAIPELKRVFGPAVKLLYLHSQATGEDTEMHQRQIAAGSPEEIEVRKAKVETVRQYFVDNIEHFDHVLLNVSMPEDLSDQLFRLILFYSGRL